MVGLPDEAVDGFTLFANEGAKDGPPDGMLLGSLNGMLDGTPDAFSDGWGEGEKDTISDGKSLGKRDSPLDGILVDLGNGLEDRYDDSLDEVADGSILDVAIVIFVGSIVRDVLEEFLTSEMEGICVG